MLMVQATNVRKEWSAVCDSAIDDYMVYSHSPNRKKHIPYIFKALIIDNPEEIGEMIVCRDGLYSFA